MDDHRRRTGERMTYELLATRTGLSRATLESLATRETYNTRLSTIEKLCRVLSCNPGNLLELTEQDKEEKREDQ